MPLEQARDTLRLPHSIGTCPNTDTNNTKQRQTKVMLATSHTAVMAKTALCHISIHTITPATILLRTAGHAHVFKQHHTFTPNSSRQFSTVKTLSFDFFSSKRSQETKKNVNSMPIVHSEPAWPHPVYTEKQMNDIVCIDFSREYS